MKNDTELSGSSDTSRGQVLLIDEKTLTLGSLALFFFSLAKNNHLLISTEYVQYWYKNKLRESNENEGINTQTH